MLRRGSSGGMYIHPWDITDEGIDDCFDFLGGVCGLNEVFLAAVYHACNFLLPHNPKRMVRWDDGSAFFIPQHPRWGDTRIRPVVGECVDTPGYLHNIVDNARGRDWGVVFFVVFHYSNSMARAYPEACCVDVMGERHRAYLCPSNPDVRAHDLAIVEELMGTYGGDGIRHESLGFGSWNYGFVNSKVPVPPSPRDRLLLGLCFCGSCIQRARDEGCDPLPLRRTIKEHLYGALSRPPEEWGEDPADEEWAGNAFGGKLWEYLEMRCNTATSLFMEIQEIINRYGGRFTPFGVVKERNVLDGVDRSQIYPHLKRVGVGARGDTPEERRASLIEQVAEIPEWAEPEVERGLSFPSMEALRDEAMMAREAGIRHHSFFYYGMTPRCRLEWLGEAKAAWA